MSYFGDEYVTQPQCWHEVRDIVRNGAPLPEADADVAFIGCGTSYYMGLAAARCREAQLGGVSDAFSALDYPRHRRYDRLVVISRSGSTAEVIETVRAAKGIPTLAITAHESSPLVELANDVVVLPFAKERSFVQTRFATSALAVWLSHCGWDVARSAADASTLLGANDAPQIGDVKQFVFLGSGPAEPLAYEAALKLREIFGTWAEAYSLSEFRHGPMAAVGPHSLIWMFGAPDEKLEDQINQTGARWFHGTDDPLVELVRVHLAADHLLAARGQGPDDLVIRARQIKGVPTTQ